MSVVTSENCPCCGSHEGSLDDSLVVAFLGGYGAHEAGLEPRAALCPKHASIAADAMAFLQAAEALDRAGMGRES